MIKTSHERVQKCNGSLYEATRYAWRAGERITQYNYVLSVIGGIVQEVYVADKWNIVQNGELVGRYEFHGKEATLNEARALIGKKIPFILNKDITITPTSYSSEANWHDNLEIQICTEGCGTVMMDEKTVFFEKGEIVVVNSNVLHHTNTNKMIKYTCIIIDTEFCRRVNIDPTVLTFSPKIKSAVLSDLIEKLDCKLIVVSYNNTYKAGSISSVNTITIEQILTTLNKKGKVSVKEIDYKYFNAGKSNLEGHKEFIFTCEVNK